MRKTIIITGGSDGLGKTIALDLASNNNVIILSENEEKLKLVSSEAKCEYYLCDVRDYEVVEQVVTDVISRFGQIDVLINNAGVWIQGELVDNDVDRIRQVIDVNLLGTINCTKAVIGSMKDKKEGMIININSQAGINYKAERSVYTAAKFGLTGFTKSLQAEVSKYGIRVTDVLPGLMKTNMFSKANNDRDLNNGIDTLEVARVVRFVIDSPKDVFIPEIGIKNINN